MGQLEIEEARGLRSCSHCGTEFHARASSDDFCCSGCEYVYSLIHEENLDKFYRLQGSDTAPVGFSVFASKNFDWLTRLVENIEADGDRTPKITLSLSGISCIGCVWLIEQLFLKQPGGQHCRIDVQRGEIQMEWIRGAFNIAAFAHKLHSFGYDLYEKRAEVPSENGKLVWRMALCGAFALNGMLYTLPNYLGMDDGFAFSTHFEWLSGIFATLSMFVGGSYFIKRAFIAARQRIVHMDLPISIGLVVAYSASCYAFWDSRNASLLYFDFISTFVFLMLCGKWLQIFAIERNRNRLAAIEIQPPLVDKISNEKCIRNFDSSNIHTDDHYILYPGHWVPVESELVSERACQGMDWINGESKSRLFSKGGRVPSGSINQGASAIELIAKERWEDALLYKLLQSGQEKSSEDREAQKWITRYLLAVMAIAFSGAGAWMMFGTLSQAVIAFVSALVVSCPCSLGVAWPLANELAASILKTKGVFVRSSSLWNRLARVTQIVFDKTGTLTRSTMEWTNGALLNTLDEDALKALSMLTANSRHPVSSTVHETLFAKGYLRQDSDWEIKEDLGQGVMGTKNGITWRFGKADWAGSANSEFTILSRDGEEIAAFDFEDRPWADAVFEIDALKQKGLRISILSGDNKEKVQKTAGALGIDEDRAIGQLSPQAKQRWMHENEGGASLILGDGANDSLAFDEALCCGTPAAEKTTLASKSDFYYLGAGIEGVRRLLEIASKRQTAIHALMVFAVAYNLVTISLALAGIVTPLMAAILMPLSSVVSLAIVWAILRTGRSSGTRGALD